MKIGITGANGFVGANLIRKLLREKYSLRALQFTNHKALDGLTVEIVKGDVNKPETLEKFCDGLDAVIHLAGKVSIGGDSFAELYKTNVVGTQNLVKACKKAGVKRFIHFSSIHALDNSPLDKVMDEKRALATQSNIPYEHTKSIGEEWVLKQQEANFDVIVLNPTAMIGPNDFKPSLMGQLFIQIAEGKIRALVPGGYNWVDVRDVCDAAIHAIKKGKGGERYILSGTWKSVVDFIQLINKELGKESVLPVLPFWVAHIGIPFIYFWSKITRTRPLYTSESLRILKMGNKKINHSKASKELGFGPRPLTESIRDTLDWLQENKLIK